MIASLEKTLPSTFNNIEVSSPEENKMCVSVPADSVSPVLSLLKKKGLDYLVLISCVDWIDERALEVVYILSCYMRADAEMTEEQQIQVLLKTRLPRENPALESVIDIFGHAEPYERELHELFGIDFEGHPRLIHLFLERDYDIPPFRKDFDNRQYVEDTFESVPSIEE
ncbi:MAG: NADH-quinone oxidoreductase subunit C [Planctomycetes bacterium]|nr:NADH-quinone oxidoreductase subunit C [Planctomycetota bacterium]